MEQLLIQVPKRLKAKLDAERKRGTGAAGLIRHLLEQYFKARRPRRSSINEGGL
jgi:hypothetical protein